MPKLLSLSLLIFLTLPGFCQGETEKESLSPGGGKVIIRGAAPIEAAPVESAPAPVANEEDSDIEELQALRQKELEKIQKIEKATEPLKKPVLNPQEEMKKLGHEQLNAAALMDEKVLALFQNVLKEGVMSKLSREEVKKMLQEKMAGSFLGKLIIKYPQLLEIFVDIMRDKEALPGLINILKRKDDLKTYGYLWLTIFVFGIWVKGRIIKPKWSFAKRLKFSLPISLILTVSTLFLFYSMFQEELSPSLAIISKHL